MKRIFGIILMLGVVMLGAVGQTQAEPLVAITTSNLLVRFDSTAPTAATTTAITGLQTNESLRGIDFRPANGLLYGLSNQSRLYTINPTTGVALFASTLTTPISSPASFYGVDFNPVVDRLRVVNIVDQNLRINVDTGETIVDSPINPASAAVSGSAYTNNFAGATSTTLYGLDSTTDTLVIQNPANSGTITTVGGLGVNVGGSGFVGFDISGQTGIAYAVFYTGAITSPSLFTINLTTGQATLIGQIGTGGFTIEGLAAPIGNQTAPIPEPATMILLGTGLAGVAARVKRRRSRATEE